MAPSKMQQACSIQLAAITGLPEIPVSAESPLLRIFEAGYRHAIETLKQRGESRSKRVNAMFIAAHWLEQEAK